MESLRQLSHFLHCSLCKQTGGPIPGGVPSVITGGAFLCNRHKTAIELTLTSKLEKALRNDNRVFTEAVGSAIVDYFGPKKFSLEPAAYPACDLSHIVKDTLSVRGTRVRSARVDWACKGDVYVTQDGMYFNVQLIGEEGDPFKKWRLEKGASYGAELSRLLNCAERLRKKHRRICEDDNDVQAVDVVKRPCLANDSDSDNDAT